MVLLAFVVGCTTTHPLSTTSPEELVHLVSVGDTIEIRKIDGTDLKFDVTQMAKDGIHGRGIFVPYDEIKQVLVSRENYFGTGLLVTLGVALLYVLEKNFDCGIFSWDTECDD